MEGILEAQPSPSLVVYKTPDGKTLKNQQEIADVSIVQFLILFYKVIS